MKYRSVLVGGDLFKSVDGLVYRLVGIKIVDEFTIYIQYQSSQNHKPFGQVVHAGSILPRTRKKCVVRQIGYDGVVVCEI